jgi:centrosomal protein CEP76
MLFQEVWDYKLTFEAWKGNNIIGEGGVDMTPKLELTLMTDDEVY